MWPLTKAFMGMHIERVIQQSQKYFSLGVAHSICLFFERPSLMRFLLEPTRFILVHK